MRPSQTGILLSVNSSSTNQCTYSQKTHKPKTKTQSFTTKTMKYVFIYLSQKHHHNIKQWSELLVLTTFSMT